MSAKVHTDAKLLETTLVAIGGALGMAVLVYDSKDKLLYANQQVMEFVNVPESCLMPGTELRMLLAHSWESRRQMASSVSSRRTYLDQESWVDERMKIHHLDWYDQVERLGPNRWVRFIARRTTSGLGMAFVLDVSEQKRHEQQWQADVERVHLTEEILDSLPFPLFVKNRNLVYIAVNKAFCNIHGVAPDDILGRTAWDLLDPDVAEQIEKEDRAVFETGKYFETVEVLSGPQKPSIQTVTRKHRIGTPGNYMLVTTLDDVSKLAEREIIRLQPSEEEPADLYALKVAKEPVRAHLPQRGSPAKILVFLDDFEISASLAKALSGPEFEACAIASISELRQFLEMAGKLKLQIPVCICDRYSLSECRTVLAAQDISPVLVDDPGSPSQTAAQVNAALEEIELIRARQKRVEPTVSIAARSNAAA